MNWVAKLFVIGCICESFARCVRSGTMFRLACADPSGVMLCYLAVVRLSNYDGFTYSYCAQYLAILHVFFVMSSNGTMPGLWIPSKVHYIIDAPYLLMDGNDKFMSERTVCSSRSLLGLLQMRQTTLQTRAHRPNRICCAFLTALLPSRTENNACRLWEKGHTMLQCRWWRLDAVRQRNNNMRNEHAQWCEHRVQARIFICEFYATHLRARGNAHCQTIRTRAEVLRCVVRLCACLRCQISQRWSVFGLEVKSV